uniref:Coatomer subunit gamma n=1 Tax=Trypanosoma congolense (strain IL3000) TaxID=1068625 RepID=G0V288_TRYCI|nr:unnamed protein product [Trypanosoma congolense IL3000]
MHFERDRYHFDEEDEDESLPFDGLEKASVLQQCRVFNDVQLDTSACLRSMTQCLHLMYTGTVLTEAEATELFFLSTKLLQSNKPRMRRLHYVLMKELSPMVEQSFIASNSLMSDIKSTNDTSKCNGIRTLFKVMNSTLYASMDRTIVESLTSQSSKVVSAALVVGLHIAQTHPEMARKWGTQLTEVLRSNSNAQYLAIALLHSLRKNDRISVRRLIEQVRAGQIRSPLALCLLIKMCTELMLEDPDGSVDLYRFVVSMARNSNDIVVVEAIKSICSLPTISVKDLSPTVTLMQLYLSASNTILRFSAIRLLNRLATTRPAAITPINGEIENLITDPNRLIATLATTTLLKTGTEQTIERLINQLSTTACMQDLGKEFKKAIIGTVKLLNVRFPSKYGVLLGFLTKVLCGEDSDDLSESVVEAMIDVARVNVKAKNAVLKHLVELIDNCNYPNIVCRALTYMGEEVPHVENPKSFVRHIYNHATLEGPEIRAVAVATLAKIAARIPSLRRSIVVLLKRIRGDTDDEVRDRAVLYTKLFLCGDEDMVRVMVSDIASAVANGRMNCDKAAPVTSAGEMDGGAGGYTSSLALREAGESGWGGAAHGGQQEINSCSSAVLQGREELFKIGRLASLGEPCSSTEPLSLSDPDSEYFVTLIKHIYLTHVVLQFKIKNTMDDVTFRHVNIQLDVGELDVEPLYAIPIEAIAPGSTEYGYVVLGYEEEQYPSGAVICHIKFAMQEDGSDDAAGDEDEYPLEGFDMTISDFIVPRDLGDNFQQKWEELQKEETNGTYALSSMRNLTVAACELADFFGMHVVGGKVQKITTASHTISMSGSMVNREKSLVMINARLFITTDNTVALQLTLRGGNAELREYLSAALLS